VWILATRAARLMHGGVGVMERKVVRVVGSGDVFDDGPAVVVGSWLMKCQPLKFAAELGMWLPVLWCGRVAEED